MRDKGVSPATNRLRLTGLLVLLCIISVGCTRRMYVPVETVRTEYKDRVLSQARIDSVFQRDSVSVFISGDTVRIEKWRDRIKYRDREVHDTLMRVRRDSVAVPYPVERKLTRWEQAKMDMGGVAMGGLAVALCIAVIWLIRKFRK